MQGELIGIVTYVVLNLLFRLLLFRRIWGSIVFKTNPVSEFLLVRTSPKLDYGIISEGILEFLTFASTQYRRHTKVLDSWIKIPCVPEIWIERGVVGISQYRPSSNAVRKEVQFSH